MKIKQILKIARKHNGKANTVISPATTQRADFRFGSASAARRFADEIERDHVNVRVFRHAIDMSASVSLMDDPAPMPTISAVAKVKVNAG